MTLILGIQPEYGRLTCNNGKKNDLGGGGGIRPKVSKNSKELQIQQLYIANMTVQIIGYLYSICLLSFKKCKSKIILSYFAFYFHKGDKILCKFTKSYVWCRSFKRMSV